jgi:hypothetical protein
MSFVGDGVKCGLRRSVTLLLALAITVILGSQEPHKPVSLSDGSGTLEVRLTQYGTRCIIRQYIGQERNMGKREETRNKR